MSNYEIKIIVTFFTLIKWKYVICTNVCSLRPAVNFNLSKEGFHRELGFSMKIIVDQHSILNNCQVVFEQTIPSGCFVNPDELADLRRMKKVMACPSGFVDVEAPEHESAPHKVHVHADLQRAGNTLTAAAKLPVHLRYHEATVGGSAATAVLGPPALLLRCNSSAECSQISKAPCGPCHREMCDWISVPYQSVTKNILISVPVGNLNHANFVTVTTLFVTIASAVWVCKAVIGATTELSSRKKK